jgi:uncharacterized protein (UPF0128 family)
VPTTLEKEIGKEVSIDIGMPYEQVDSIIKGATDYVRHVMENSGFETVMIPYFGKFTVNPYRLKYYNESKIKRRRDEAIQRGKSSDNN